MVRPRSSSCRRSAANRRPVAKNSTKSAHCLTTSSRGKNHEPACREPALGAGIGLEPGPFPLAGPVDWRPVCTRALAGAPRAQLDPLCGRASGDAHVGALPGAHALGALAGGRGSASAGIGDAIVMQAVSTQAGSMVEPGSMLSDLLPVLVLVWLVGVAFTGYGDRRRRIGRCGAEGIVRPKGQRLWTDRTHGRHCRRRGQHHCRRCDHGAQVKRPRAPHHGAVITQFEPPQIRLHAQAACERETEGAFASADARSCHVFSRQPGHMQLAAGCGHERLVRAIEPDDGANRNCFYRYPVRQL